MKRRNVLISTFVIAWGLFFGYQSLRLNYLNPLLGKNMPAAKFLFPPAGWIMFYRIDPDYGRAEIYGFQGDKQSRLTAEDIFSTRSFAYDNFRRNILSDVLYKEKSAEFCAYLGWKLSQFDRFRVVYAQYPDLIARPDTIERYLIYTCPPDDA